MYIYIYIQMYHDLSIIHHRVADWLMPLSYPVADAEKNTINSDNQIVVGIFKLKVVKIPLTRHHLYWKTLRSLIIFEVHKSH